MADNLTTQSATLATVPGSTIIATDDAGAGGHVQIVKLALSTDGSASLITADASGLEVQGAGTAGTPAGGVVSVQGVTSGTTIPVTLSAAVPAGTNNIGDVDVLSIAAGDNNIGNVDVVTLPAVTNAGTFAVQESGSALTALQLIDNLVATEDAVAGTGYAGVPTLVVRQDSQTALAADGDFISPTIDAVGGLRVSIVAGGGSGGTSLADDADFLDGTTAGTPIGGVAESASPTAVTEGDFGWAAITLNRAFKVSSFTPAGQSTIDDTADAQKVLLVDAAGATLTADTQGTQDTALGTITSVTGGMQLMRASAAAPTAVSADDDAVLPWSLRNGAQVVNLAAGGTLITGSVSAALDVSERGAGLADDAAFTPGTTRVIMAGFEADEAAIDSVDEGDGGAARMTLDRKVIVTPQPHTAGGLSTFMASGSDGSSILVATAQAIKASAGQLYGYYLYNPEAAVTFVHFYNVAAASVTVGTTNPLFTLQIPTVSAANLMFTHGVTFSNAGWSIAATTTAGGNTAPATGVSATIWYV